jgi:hypothetical protein
MSEHELHSLSHVTMISVGRPDVVAEIGILKTSAKDLSQIYGSNYRAIILATKEKTNTITLGRPPKKAQELLCCLWRRSQATMQSALAVEGDKLVTVLFKRMTQKNALAKNHLIIHL